MDTAELLEVMLQIVEGVRHVHAAGYIHRDLKPDNALMGVDGHVKLCDFGCAARIGNSADLETKCAFPSPTCHWKSNKGTSNHVLPCCAFHAA